MPSLYIFSGLPGTGKSTLSRGLSGHFGAAYVQIDTLENGLRAMLSQPVVAEGYDLAMCIAKDNLGLGLDVVADSCNGVQITRDGWYDVAEQTNATPVDIEVVCSDVAEHRRRVESRRSSEGKDQPSWQDVVEREYLPWTTPRIVLDTASLAPETVLARLLDTLT
jgi:predicted kinase